MQIDEISEQQNDDFKEKRFKKLTLNEDIINENNNNELSNFESHFQNDFIQNRNGQNDIIQIDQLRKSGFNLASSVLS